MQSAVAQPSVAGCRHPLVLHGRAGPARRPMAAATAATPAAAIVHEPFRVLSDWLTNNGGNVSSITVGNCQMGDITVRGLVATQDLSTSTPAISVPISNTLRDDQAPIVYPKAPWNVNLAAYILDERSKCNSSRLWPYICTLPAESNSPLLLPDNALQEVQYPPAVAAIQSYQQLAGESFRQCNSACTGAGKAAVSWPDWVWALHMVQSRSIRLAITGCKVMIPGIDLLNHGGPAANGQLVLGRASWQVEGEPAVCFVTTKAIQAGQQVLWSYGQRSNDDFFVYHGFAIDNNPDEDVQLFSDVQELIGWAVQQLLELQPLSRIVDIQQLTAAAAAAASKAVQTAAAHCSPAAIQGTSSSVLVHLSTLVQYQECSQLQNSQQEHTWRQQQRSQKNLIAEGTCEGAVQAALKRSPLHRRLASCRLHSPEWGTAACPSLSPELVARRDGAVDVRVPAVIAALQDQLHAPQGLDPLHGSPEGNQLMQAMQQCVSRRCQELLSAYATSTEEDERLLQQQHSYNSFGSHVEVSDDLMTTVVRYRREKKLVLKQLISHASQTSLASSSYP